MKGTVSPSPGRADFRAFYAARNVCRTDGRGLYFASAFMPGAKRDAAHAVFAFCRLIRNTIITGDEAAGSRAARLRHYPLSAQSLTTALDETGAGTSGTCCGPDSTDQRLALLRDRLGAIYGAGVELPRPESRSIEQHVLHAFAITARRYEIPKRYFIEWAESFRTDVSVSRYATWAALERQCRRSGGGAGLIASAVLGLTNSDASAYAIKAGVAIRFTKILCDLPRDAAAGRVYLPLEDLASFRYAERDLTSGRVNENFRNLMQFEVRRARQLYREAADGLCWVAGDGSRLAAATVLTWHRGLLDVIERRGFDVFSRSPTLTKAERLRLLPAAWRLARRPPDATTPAPPSGPERVESENPTLAPVL